ncbi:MAG: hypothetical protein ACXWT0_03790 [Methylobacter sp.]
MSPKLRLIESGVFKQSIHTEANLDRIVDRDWLERNRDMVLVKLEHAVKDAVHEDCISCPHNITRISHHNDLLLDSTIVTAVSRCEQRVCPSQTTLLRKAVVVCADPIAQPVKKEAVAKPRRKNFGTW